MTVLPTFRGCRAIVAAAAVTALSLFAAPPSAQADTYDVTVTLSVTVATDGTATLSPSSTPSPDSNEDVGYQFQDREGNGDYGDGWWNMGVDGTHEIDPSFWLTDGPYYVRARAWRTHDDDGESTLTYSEPSAEVEVVLPE
jgi:hypothetical protein